MGLVDTDYYHNQCPYCKKKVMIAIQFKNDAVSNIRMNKIEWPIIEYSGGLEALNVVCVDSKVD